MSPDTYQLSQMDPRNALPLAHRGFVLYTEADAQCDKLHVVKLVSRTLTVASILKLVRPTPSVHLCRTKNQLDMLNRFNTIPACGRQTDRQTDSGLVRSATNKTRSPVSLGKLAS